MSEILHYYGSPIGDGEFSRNRFRALCQPDHAVATFIPSSERGVTRPPIDTPVCQDCTDVAAALGLDLTRRGA